MPAEPDVGDLFAGAPPPVSPLNRYRILSPTCSLRVSPLAIGGMSFGEAWNGFMGTMTKPDTFKLLDRFYEMGGNFIDLANNYQEGESERWTGEWMAGQKNRDEMVIATKFSIGYMSRDAKIKVNTQGNGAKSMNLSVDASLKKLGTHYIDILYLHFWDYTTSVEEVMQSLNNLVKAGKVLYLGISDTPAWIVAKCCQYARDHGLAQFVIYQGLFNVMKRDFEREIIPMAIDFGLALAPWGAMGSGRFLSSTQLEAKAKAGEKIRSMGGPVQTPEEVAISAALEKVAKEIGGTASVTGVALAYVMSKSPYIFPIIGGRKVEYLEENAASLEIDLTPAQIEYLEGINKFEIGFPTDFIGPDPSTHGGQVGWLLSTNGNYAIVEKPKAIRPQKQ